MLLDRREVACGSTSVSTGLLQYEIDMHLVDLAKQIGWEPVAQAYHLCRSAIDKIGKLVSEFPDDCGFVERPSLYFASRQKDVAQLREEFDARVKAKFDVEWLEAAAIQERFDFAAAGAIRSRDGGQIDPFRLTHHLLHRATGAGLKVFDRTEVVRWEVQPNGLRLHTDRGPQVFASNVVFATGFESQNYLRQKVGTLISTYAILSQPFESNFWEDNALIWETARPYLYFRRTDDGRILIGGEDDNFRSPTLRDARVGKKTQKLLTRFNKLFPHVPIEAEYAWGGTFGETKDGLAYIGPTEEILHAYFALGYGGNGITYSAIAAEIICDAILAKENPNAHLFRFDR